MKQIQAVLIREWRRITGNKLYLFLVLIWPVLYGILMGSIYSQKVVTKMPIAVADLDHSALSRTLIRYLNSSRSFDIVYHVGSAPELEDLILRDRVAAGIFIPSGLQKEIKRGGSEAVTAFVSGSNLLMANIAVSELKTVAGTIAAGARVKYLRKTGNSIHKAMALQSPVQVDFYRMYNPGFNYMNYLTPGLWATILHQILILLGALLICREWEQGTFWDLWETGGRKLTTVVIGKIALYVLLGFVFMELYFRVFFPVFGIDVRGNISAMVAYSFVFVLSAVGLGFLASVALVSSVNAMKAVLLITAPAFLLSGYTWPLSEMPWFTRMLGRAIPLTTYLHGFRKIYQEGEGLLSVGNETLIMLLMGCGSILVGALLLNRRVKKYASAT